MTRHHASCKASDRALVYHCSQCGLVEQIDESAAAHDHDALNGLRVNGFEPLAAARAYPRLVDALRDLQHIVYTYQTGLAKNIIAMPKFKETEALIRELGEDA